MESWESDERPPPLLPSPPPSPTSDDYDDYDDEEDEQGCQVGYFGDVLARKMAGTCSCGLS